MEDDKLDAARYRWLRDILMGSLAGGIEVNDERLVYEEVPPGEAVRIYWYADTPVGFYQAQANTLDEAVDEGMKHGR